MYGTPLPKQPKFTPGLVRGQLTRTPLRIATVVIIGIEPSQPTQPILEYPSHEETPNEKSRRQLQRRVMDKHNQHAISSMILQQFGIVFEGDIL
jgi:hypothetical protein